MLKNTVSEMKNTLEGINIRSSDTEEHTFDLENRIMETTQSEQQKNLKKMRPRDLWDNIKCTNIHIIAVPEGGERERSKMYLVKLWLKTSQTRRRKQISRYRNHRESQTR